MTEPSTHSQTPAADAASLDRRFFLKTSVLVAAGSGHGFNLAILLGLVAVFLSSGTAGAEASIKGPAAPQAQASYFVSPQGSDSNSGTCESPFLTITKARDVVRARHPAMTGDIHVYLRGGTYPLSQTIQFTNADSGRNGHYIHYQAYKDEKPELSGALKVTGWTMHNPGKNIYRANVGTSLKFRSLYVNGVRAVMAVNNTAAEAIAFGQLSDTTVVLPSSGFGSDMARWENVNHIEFTEKSYGWKLMSFAVDSIHGNVATMTQGWFAARKYLNAFPRALYQVRNAYELLDSEGEFYLNRVTGYLYYKPRKGENMDAATFLVPSVETLVSVKGSYGNKVVNLVFDGLTFSYNTWFLPGSPVGYGVCQAGQWTDMSDVYNTDNFGGSRTPGTLDLVNAEACIVTKTTFTHTGMTGLALGEGCHYNLVAMNVFSDIGSDGITVGEFNRRAQHQTDVRFQTIGNVIEQNTITTCGAEYGANLGIVVGYTEGTIVQHNTIHEMPYGGISCGWGWGMHDDEGPLQCKNNTIRYNLVYDHLKAFGDGGAIYSLGEQRGTSVSHNYAHSQFSAGNMIYLDNGSTGITVEDNVVVKGKGTVVEAYVSNCNGPNGGVSSHDNNFQNNFYDQSFTLTASVNGNITWKNNVAVNPDNLPSRAADIIRDAGAGNHNGCPPVTPKPSRLDAGAAPEPLPNPLVINDSNPAIVFTGDWKHSHVGADINVFLNDYHSGLTDGSSLTYAFHGTGVGISFMRGTCLGECDIYIDDVLQTHLDLGVGKPSTRLDLFTKIDLPPGNHTIKAVKSGRSYAIHFDAISVFGSDQGKAAATGAGSGK